MSGTRLGKFEVVRRLGEGGMAEVFLCAQEGPAGFRKKVAIKALHPRHAGRDDMVTMFLDEARLAARLSHPNLVQTYELLQLDGRYLLVQEYVHGVSFAALTDALTRRGERWPRRALLTAFAAACDGLEYAHNLADEEGRPLGVIHRDVSLENLMLTYEGGVKVVDFGVAKAAGNVYQTQKTFLRGKIPYLAPERIQNNAGVDRRVDVFALGVALFAALTDRLPFSAEHELELFRVILHDPAPSPCAYDDTIPEPLAAIVLRALAKSPELRHPSARALAEELRAFLAEHGGPVEAPELAELLRTLVPPLEHESGLTRAPAPEPGRITAVIDPEPPAAAGFSDHDTEVSLPAPAPAVTTAPDAARRSFAEQPTVPAARGARARTAWRRGSARWLGAAAALGVLVAALLLWPERRLPEPPATGSAAPADDRHDAPAAAPVAATAARPAPPSAEPERARVAASARPRPRAPAPRPPAVAREARPAEPPPSAPVSARGELWIETDPAVEISVGGRRLGRTPLAAAVELPPGPHTVTLSDERLGLRAKESVELRPGERTVLRRSFRTGRLMVFVSPFGELRVAGVARGLTPLDAPIELVEGRHAVHATCALTGKSATEQVEIVAGRQTTVKLDLR